MICKYKSIAYSFFFQLLFENRYYNKRCIFNKVQRMNLLWKYFPTYVCTYTYDHTIFPHYVSLENISVWIIDFCWSRIEIFIRMYKMCDYLYHLFIYTYTHSLPLHNTWYILLVIKQSFLSLWRFLPPTSCNFVSFLKVCNVL